MITFAIVSGEGWLSRENSMYKFIIGDYTISEARARCAELGGHPVRIETIEEHNAISAMIDANSSKKNYSSINQGPYSRN